MKRLFAELILGIVVVAVAFSLLVLVVSTLGRPGLTPTTAPATQVK